MSSASDRNRSGRQTPGVRGPGGPGGPGSSAPRSRPAAPPAGRSRLETISYPYLRTMHSMPRWIIVVLPAVLLLGGLAIPASFAWIGGILLLIVLLFVAWLTALSWPAITPGAKFVRVVILIALAGITALKFTGRF